MKAKINDIVALSLSLLVLALFLSTLKIGREAFLLAFLALALSIVAFVSTIRKVALPKYEYLKSYIIRKKFLGYSAAISGIVIFMVIIKYSLGLKWASVGTLLGTSLTATTPLVFAAVGESLNEKAGTINIGLEGIFLITALMGVCGAEFFGSSWIGGLFTGAAVGGLIGFLFGIACAYLRANQIVAGMGVNIFAAGVVSFWLMAIWGQAGQYTPSGHEGGLFIPTISTPIGSLSPLIFVAIGLAILAHFLLHKTLFGIKLRALGEKPESADTRGIRVNRMRILLCTIGALLAGLGGAFLSLTWVHTVTKEMIAGYGFIALACVVFSGLEPMLTLLPAFLFGFGRALSPWAEMLPAVKAIFPGIMYFLHMTPFILVLIAIAIVGRKLFPRAIGKPYIRE